MAVNRKFLVLALAVAGLLAFGAVMMSGIDAHYAAVGREPAMVFAGYLRHQLAWIGIGLALMVVVARVDYRRWREWALSFAGMVSALLVLALVPGMGPEIKGNHRWLYLGPWGFIRPSALAGMAVVLVLAWWYEARKSRSGTPFWIPSAVLGLLAGLILVEMDFTTALVVLLTGVILMILGGERIDYLAYCVLGAATGLAWLISRDPVRIAQLQGRFAGNPAEPACIPLHRLALMDGGWFGAGLGDGHGVGCFLPEAPGEFMLTVIGEELGLAGLLAVNALYLVIAVSGAVIGAKAPDRFGTLLAFGIVVSTIVPVGLNLAILIGPGLLHFPPLPFVSSGGLHLCASLIGVGMLWNISRNRGGQDHERNRTDDGGETRDPGAAPAP